MSDTNNKRRFVRMELEDIPTTITREDGTSFEAACKDLSGLGMLIECEEILTEGEEVIAHVKTERNELSVTATVARITSEENIHRYGLTISIFN